MKMVITFEGNLYDGKLSREAQFSVLKKIGKHTIEYDVEGNSGFTLYYLPYHWKLENEWKEGDWIEADMEPRDEADKWIKSLCPWAYLVGVDDQLCDLGWIVGIPFPIYPANSEGIPEWQREQDEYDYDTANTDKS